MVTFRVRRTTPYSQPNLSSFFHQSIFLLCCGHISIFICANNGVIFGFFFGGNSLTSTRWWGEVCCHRTRSSPPRSTGWSSGPPTRSVPSQSSGIFFNSSLIFFFSLFLLLFLALLWNQRGEILVNWIDKTIFLCKILFRFIFYFYGLSLAFTISAFKNLFSRLERRNFLDLFLVISDGIGNYLFLCLYDSGIFWESWRRSRKVTGKFWPLTRYLISNFGHYVMVLHKDELYEHPYRLNTGLISFLRFMHVGVAIGYWFGNNKVERFQYTF